MVFSVLLYGPHKRLGTGLKPILPICQLLSVGSQQFGLNTDLCKGDSQEHVYMGCSALGRPQVSQVQSEGPPVPV